MTTTTVILSLILASTDNGLSSEAGWSEWGGERTQKWMTQKGLNYNTNDGWTDLTGIDLVSNSITDKLNISNPIHIAKLEAYSQLYRGMCPCNTNNGVQSLVDVAWYTPSPHSVYFLLANTRMYFLYTFFTTSIPPWSDTGNVSAVFSPSFKPSNYSTTIAKESTMEESSYSSMVYLILSVALPYLTAVWHVFVFYNLNPFLFLGYLVGAVIETTDEAIRLFDLVATLGATPTSEMQDRFKDILFLCADCAIHWGFDFLIIVILYFVEGYLPFFVQTLCIVIIVGLHSYGVVLLL
eukprot:TRINITY_DN5123_c6_g1_i1.p1 TRINITY_DN5123_c6_g1~~TRINITY_DN5123_c6_g1_i1.p1  ORF type:complete len:295 (+),score=50.10 TRINITY_DN5123_c6_g1_i1:142-1026(+)